MNASTARALFVGLLVAVWVWLSGQARLRSRSGPGSWRWAATWRRRRRLWAPEDCDRHPVGCRVGAGR